MTLEARYTGDEVSKAHDLGYADGYGFGRVDIAKEIIQIANKMYAMDAAAHMRVVWCVNKALRKELS